MATEKTPSKTKYAYLSGEISWPYLNKLDKYDCYSVTIKLDPESIETMKALPLKLKDRGDNTYILKRKPTIVVRGETKELGAPDVLNADATPFDNSKMIGNGTLATVKIAYYVTKIGYGHRLDKVRIDELIEYMPSDGRENF